jgi:hypothetical protein
MESIKRSKAIAGILKVATNNTSLPPKVAGAVQCSEELQYHIDQEIPLGNNIFRIYSKAFYNLFNESRGLWKQGSLVVSENDEWFLKNDIGKFAEVDGNLVPLDLPIPVELYEESFLNKQAADKKKKAPKLNSPRRVRKGDPGYGRKKFIVHVKDPSTGNVKTVTFGDPNLSIKGSSPERRKSFLARHNCDSPGPKTKARYWSCNIHRYKEQLGLSFEGRW